MRPKRYARYFIITILALLLLGIESSVLVRPGERGVLLHWNKVQRGQILEEGFHFVLPLRDKVEITDIRPRRIETKIPAYSKDHNDVDVACTLIFHPDPQRVDQLYEAAGRNYESQLILPAVHTVVKTTLAQYTPLEIADQRPAIRERIKALLRDRLANNHLIVDEFAIIDFQFSEAVERAMEEKLIAKQKALQAENKRQQIEAEKALRRSKRK
ncbi:MAG: prohibitin family protein [Deltaproteobacteria bacterium]|nr:prohibitin family protein [Deltaproteobacteria bacterium]